MQYQKKHVVSGSVYSHQPYGIFLQLDDTNYGLLKIPYFPEDFDCKENKWPPIGSQMRCIILDVEETNEGLKIVLSARKSDFDHFAEEWSTF